MNGLTIHPTYAHEFKGFLELYDKGSNRTTYGDWAFRSGSSGLTYRANDGGEDELMMILYKACVWMNENGTLFKNPQEIKELYMDDKIIAWRIHYK